jgi:FMN reductase (NADPH)
MPTSSNTSETIRVMQTHFSVRHYKPEPIPKDHVLEIIKAAQGAASSNFVQACSIILVTDVEKKRQIATLGNNQQHVNECPVFLLFCADMKRLEHAGKKQGVQIQFDTLENFIVTIVDTALMAQNAITAAESLGYGGCYIGGVRNNPGLISDLVRLPDKVFPLFGMCLGVPAERHDVKPRLPIEAVLHENEYREDQYDRLIEQYDKEMNTYYLARSSNNKDSNWSKTMADFLKERRRTHMRDFLASKGFHLI